MEPIKQFESTDSKVKIAANLEQVINWINLTEPYLDFYWKNFDATAKKEWTASYIRTDILKLINIFEQSFFKNWQLWREDYTLSALRRQLFLEANDRKNASNAKIPIIRTFVDRLKKWIVNANFTLKANALTSDYKNSVEAVQAAVEWCYSSAQWRKKIMDAVQCALLNGNWYIKATFKTPKEKLASIQNPESKSYMKIEDTYSDIKWISEFELFYDPTLSLDEQRYVIYRGIKPIRSILKMIETMDRKIDVEHLNYIMKNPKPFSRKDYSQIRMIKYWWLEATRKWQNYSMDNLFNITFNNDKAEYVEIWTPDTLSICINWWIVADTENPYKDRRYWHPYYSCHYAENPWVSIWEWAWVILADIQKAYDWLFNLLLDHSSMTASPMLWVQAWKVIFNNKNVDHNLQWKPWWVLEMEDKWNMDFIVPPALDQWIITTLQEMLETANFAISPTSYSDYSSQSRSATDSQARFDWLSDSVALLIDSVSNMLTQIADNWLIDMQDKMPELFELPTYNSKWMIEWWKKVNRKALEWKYIFEWTSDSIADANDLVNKSQLDEYLTNLTRVWMPWDWTTYIDIPNLLDYINWLYKWPNNIVRSESTYYNKMAEDQQRRAEIQADVQQIQANAEMEIQQQQQMAQEWAQMEAEEWQMMQPGEQPQQQWNADMAAALQQMFWW